MPHLLQARTSGGFGLTYFWFGAGRDDPPRSSLSTATTTGASLVSGTPARRGRLIVTAPYVSVTMQQMVVTLAEPVSHRGPGDRGRRADLSLDALIDEVLAMKVQEGYAMLLVVPASSSATRTRSWRSSRWRSWIPASRGGAGCVERGRRAARRQPERARGAAALGQGVPGTDWLLAMVMYKDVLEAPARHPAVATGGLDPALLLVFGALLIAMFNYLFADPAGCRRRLPPSPTARGSTVQIATSSKDEVGLLAQNQPVRDPAARHRQPVAGRHHRAGGPVQDPGGRGRGAQPAGAPAAGRDRHGGDRGDQRWPPPPGDRRQRRVCRHHRRGGGQLAVAGQSQVGQSQRSITGLADEVSDASQTIHELDGHASRSSGILATISGIAEQTNLLALNAAIEAARAGEQGRALPWWRTRCGYFRRAPTTPPAEIQQMIEACSRPPAAPWAAWRPAAGWRAPAWRMRNPQPEPGRGSARPSLHQRHGATQIAAAAEEQTRCISAATLRTSATPPGAGGAGWRRLSRRSSATY